MRLGELGVGMRGMAHAIRQWRKPAGWLAAATLIAAPAVAYDRYGDAINVASQSHKDGAAPVPVTAGANSASTPKLGDGVTAQQHMQQTGSQAGGSGTTTTTHVAASIDGDTSVRLTINGEVVPITQNSPADQTVTTNGPGDISVTMHSTASGQAGGSSSSLTVNTTSSSEGD